jgi:hypothetical protein
MPGVLTDIVTIDSLDNYDLIPPVGQDLEVTDIGASIIAGAGLAGVPQVLAGVFDGVAAFGANFRRSSAAAPSIRGWDKPPKWFINPTNFLRINNPDVALPVNVAISYKIAADYGPNGVSKVISDVRDMIAGEVWEVRPPAGQDWDIRDIGTSRWSAGAGGLPNVTVELTDGVSFATIAIGTENFGWHSFDIHINHDVWLRFTNPGGAPATVGFSGIISKDYGPNGVSEVASLVGTVLGGAANILLVRPPIGQEWKVTRIGGSVLTAAAPLSLPDVVAALTDAAPIVSPVLQGTEDKGWFDDLEIYLNHDNWMTITDTPAAGADLGVSAFITEA